MYFKPTELLPADPPAKCAQVFMVFPARSREDR